MPSKRPELQEELKGFKLVAIADGIGLYRQGGVFATSRGYGPNTHVMLGLSGYPLPPEGRWRWLYKAAGLGEQIGEFVEGQVKRLRA